MTARGFEGSTPEGARLPVYKNMKEDPVYAKYSFIDFDSDIFGYTMAAEENGKIVAIGGEEGKVPYLHINEKVKLTGDSIGLGGLTTTEEAEIVELCNPFKVGMADHIVRLKQGDLIAWVKPYQVEKIY